MDKKDRSVTQILSLQNVEYTHKQCRPTHTQNTAIPTQHEQRM